MPLTKLGSMLHLCFGFYTIYCYTEMYINGNQLHNVHTTSGHSAQKGHMQQVVFMSCKMVNDERRKNIHHKYVAGIGMGWTVTGWNFFMTFYTDEHISIKRCHQKTGRHHNSRNGNTKRYGCIVLGLNAAGATQKFHIILSRLLTRIPSSTHNNDW